MPNLNFYPGPSKLYAEVEQYLTEAYGSGILEQNHRSEPFMAMLADTIINFKIKLNVPPDYSVYFTSSATECWEITAQSMFNGKIQFLYNGAFGKKWFKYAVTNPQANSTLNAQKSVIRGSRFFVDQQAAEVEIDEENDVLCVVACETSNGTQIDNETIKKLKQKSPNALICVDATSIMGGVNIDFSLADVWFASSQKCFGLPAGLGIMVVSPNALAQAHVINERNHYNSLIFIEENFSKFQTHYTPNVLGIYLLNRLLVDLENIDLLSKKIKERAKLLYDFFENHPKFEPVVANKNTRSDTVLTIKCEDLKGLKTLALKNNIIIGNGYGEWKADTFRIANFPAIPDYDFEILLNVFKSIN